ncbi:D-aminoacyl-tRNA deacylase [Halobacteriovorax sp. JY17]|uniref:D-aminoacyl-tRNA deacylase n=1 Tax=Halobacteriovorax sp. JY17 TaxID=2014617 RepID=UPI000C4634D9|nr:D-aminoacyl-tRNA deacylase [Halobacteriovorax sp. JY17]PIK16226.1 MAG: D-tyrosyl-tRNA(Tyr) deacylase [Halobacteriovorax sp. JY17]
MKIVVQRSLQSSVTVNNEVVGTIPKGMVLLVCMEKSDTDQSVQKAAEKILNLRIFSDSEGRMNENISKSGGEILAVSQFTLSWPGKKGNRPSFDNSMEPELANNFFEKFCNLLERSIVVKKGIFGENMQVTIGNDGPVTFFLEF